MVTVADGSLACGKPRELWANACSDGAGCHYREVTKAGRPDLTASEQSVVQKAFNLRWRWLGLAFSVSDRKLVISRKRGPRTVHLTVAYRTASGQVDFHLKHEPPAPGEEAYVPLAKIAPEHLASFGEFLNWTWAPLVREVTDHWKPVRPGWLSRCGYAVLLVEREKSLERFRAFVPSKRRGKHDLTFEPLKDPKYVRQFVDSLYPGRILRYVPPNLVQLPIHAEIVGRRKRRHSLLIGSFAIDGRDRWLMIPKQRMIEMSDKLGAEMVSRLGAALSPEFGTLIETVVDELGLDEIAELGDLLAGVRRFVASPHGAVEKARRRAKAWTAPKRERESYVARYSRLRSLGHEARRKRR